jgi:hypothetical protein
VTAEATDDAGDRPTGMFRWAGHYWGFRQRDRLYDRYGRQVGWIEIDPGGRRDVFDLSGGFLGEVVDEHYVLRYLLRGEPVHRASRPAIPSRTPPAPLPDRGPRDPRADWFDALPWPLPPPRPPQP